MREPHALTELFRVRDSSPLLDGLSEGELRVLAAEGYIKSGSPGGYLCQQGDPSHLLYLITQGKAIYYRVTVPGRRVLLDAVGPGGIVGSYFLTSDTYFFSAQTLGAVTAVVWSQQAQAHLLLRVPRLGVNALRLAVTRSFEQAEMCCELVADPVDRRLASALLRLSENVGDRLYKSVRIVGLSEEEVAISAGTTLSTANRTLRKWARQGVIRTGRRLVVIRDPVRLAKIAGKLPLLSIS